MAASWENADVLSSTMSAAPPAIEARAVRAQRSRHAPHGLGDDGHRDQLQSVQKPRAHGPAQRGGAVGKQQERQGRGQRESRPGGESAEVARAK
jgi:hypothetical protein